jgi:aerobic C4-dicarboxylate transport protein
MWFSTFVSASQYPLGDGFISLAKTLISPDIFCTVVLGIAGAGDRQKVGRVRGKALLCFEVVSTFALAHWEKELDRDAMNAALKS